MCPARFHRLASYVSTAGALGGSHWRLTLGDSLHDTATALPPARLRFTLKTFTLRHAVKRSSADNACL